MITALLTGVTSFIGRHLAKSLAQSGIRVLATYRTANHSLFQALETVSPNLKLIQLNSFNEVELDKLPPLIDAVVHLAGVSTMSGASIDDMLNVNVMGTLNLQRYAMRAGACKFIYASSLSIHGKIKSGVVDEHTPVNDPDPYGATKYLGERLLASAAGTMPTVAIRLPGVLGCGAHRAWIPTLVERLVSGGEVSVYSPNAEFNNAVHVSDLSSLIVQVLLNKVWHGYFAFPVGASGKMNILEVIDFFREGLNSDSKLCVVKEIKPSFLIDSTFAVETFGYVPTRIDVILQRYLENILYH
jgi:nucleoside-diphosphate-sugar epimerase